MDRLLKLPNSYEGIFLQSFVITKDDLHIMFYKVVEGIVCTSDKAIQEVVRSKVFFTDLINAGSISEFWVTCTNIVTGGLAI